MKIKQDFCLLPFNTLGIDIVARKLSIINSIDDLNILFNEEQLKANKILIISKGSNILFTSNFEGLILLNQILGKKIIKQDKNDIFLNVSSGESWSGLVKYTISNNWGGLENMTDIPGKVGAAPIQNIGAYGSEIKDAIVSLEAFDLHTGKIIKFSNKECNFEYRTSIFKTTHKNRFFITSVVFKLSLKPKVNITYKPLAEVFNNKNLADININDVSKKISEIRNSKIPDPEQLKNAGSFFKNPIIGIEKLKKIKLTSPSVPSYLIDNRNFKIPAAWLIEQCGWKGKRKGDVGTYEKQALILINYGKATGFEILHFANKIQESVFTKFGINLEMEVTVI